MPLVSISVQTDDSELLLPDLHEAQNFHQSRSFKNKYLSELRPQDIVRTRHEGWMSHRTNKCLFLLLFVIAFGCIGLIFFGYYCTGTNALCAFPTYKTNGLKKYITTDIIGEPLKSSRVSNLPTFEEVVSKDFQFDIEDHDVMVFLHMQKTGGTTFGHHLVKDLELERDCVCHRKIKKRCTCLRPGTHSKETWLFSRYSTGWKCGLHADWTELTACVDYVMDEIDAHSVKRRYFYITFLREPIHRYLSEYRHVKRGATWKNTLLRCNGRPATEEEVPPCYEGETWADVTLEDFVSCKSNLANNRQTRMLADLSLVNCYDTTSMKPEERDTILLASAKNNLHRMALFGLTEFQ
ncbi:UNVERIFIED_CONTAM: hypothetical protein GTU68_023968, partial [Idotea baltica]|nr:hypothetical protein [Idotea baltica]